MKSKEELNDLKKEVEALNKKLSDLNEEELKQITGGDVLFDLDTQHKYELPDDHWGKWQSEMVCDVNNCRLNKEECLTYQYHPEICYKK